MTPHPDARPLLSFVMTGRNDGFMGDFVWRIETAVNILARSADRLGRLSDIEIVVVDWNSDVPLRDVVSLRREAALITRFVTVPGAIAVPRQQDTHFPDSIVINTGVRRARGEFISQTGSDVVFTTATLAALLGVLEGRIGYDLPLQKAFMTGGRRHIPNGIIRRGLALEEFECYLERNAAFFPEERGGPGHAAPTNLMLMHHDLWHASRGFDERFIYWGFNDIDLALRVTARHGFIPLENFGVNSLHMEHWTTPRDYSPQRMFRRLNPVDNLMPHFTPNSETWGLGDVELPPSLIPPREAHRDAELSLMPPTLEELASQIQEPAVANVVRDIVTAFSGLPIPQTDHAALLCIAWVVTRRAPRAFLEVGFRYPHAAALVARNSPGTELFAVVDWERRAVDDGVFYPSEGTSLIFFVSHALRQNGHWAYTHFMRASGSPVDSAHDGITRGGPYDLALVRGGHATPALISTVSSAMRPTGIAIVTDDDPSRCQAVATDVARGWAGSLVIPIAEGCNALVLMPSHP